MPSLLITKHLASASAARPFQTKGWKQQMKMPNVTTVSYTHLDVYKRQAFYSSALEKSCYCDR